MLQVFRQSGFRFLIAFALGAVCISESAYSVGYRPWGELTLKQKCKEVLVVAAFIGGITGFVWVATEGPILYRQHKIRVQRMTQLQGPYENFLKEYRQLISIDSRYEQLVAILLKEAIRSESFSEFFGNSDFMAEEVKALGLTPDDVKNLPYSFKKAALEFGLQILASGLKYEDVQLLLKRIPSTKNQ